MINKQFKGGCMLYPDVSVNDRVRISQAGRCEYVSSLTNPHGVYGTIIELDGLCSNPIKVKWDNGTVNVYKPEHLELKSGSNQLDEIITNKLPPEPIPGQFYRTKANRKVLCIGKSIESWVYEDVITETLLRYDLPFRYTDDGFTGDRDIAAPWTEPLPAIEIKWWAVVYNVNHGVNGKKKRGGIISIHVSKSQAEKYLIDKSEIVELVGTLPAREESSCVAETKPK